VIDVTQFLVVVTNGDERDRTANLLVANRALQPQFCHRKRFSEDHLQFLGNGAKFSRESEILRRILKEYRRFSARAEIDGSFLPVLWPGMTHAPGSAANLEKRCVCLGLSQRMMQHANPRVWVMRRLFGIPPVDVANHLAPFLLPSQDETMAPLGTHKRNGSLSGSNDG
jgi:hypothetical protein